ncbi:hypothetical protein C900_01859 [Fulvivirga imtechensis AK7]|uniref:Uncharacterized protein n=1 Tax=Fulvivirga imtechensis AK7 TaxID=1237149 RepID=L8JY29_9BACT|nr:hypothetical protein C900_01859 [Fulvivirga imtechensis AK7]
MKGAYHKNKFPFQLLKTKNDFKKFNIRLIISSYQVNFLIMRRLQR